ncbi:unnamed protein product [Caenorhabditis auriculariae]|uniref:Uncharacterized protein n=1 Tax=Caenorhabditis auriculariae TaxID=2777116 RepID=A0A8S1H7G1_9PELO|nr:unnamed protein product [Caenorhabditis auriculariae]
MTTCSSRKNNDVKNGPSPQEPEPVQVQVQAQAQAQIPPVKPVETKSTVETSENPTIKEEPKKESQENLKIEVRKMPPSSVKLVLKGENPDKDDDKRMDRKSEVPEKDMILDNQNASVAFILEHGTETHASGEFERHAKIVIDQTSLFQWGMKKHYNSDETSWRHMNKRILLLKIEGLDAGINTRRARDRKKEKAKTCTTKLDALLKVPKKKKKKEGTAD